MNFLRTLLLGAMMVGAISLPAFAFDMVKDATDWTKDPTCLMTLYAGMPKSEIDNNFSDSAKNGWNRIDTKEEEPIYHETIDFHREEPFEKSKNIIGQEDINANIRDNHVHYYGLGFIFLAKEPPHGPNEQFHISLSSKEYESVFSKATDIYVAMMYNLRAKYGEPEKREQRMDFHDPHHNNAWIGQMRSVEWKADGVNYRLSLEFNKLDHVGYRFAGPQNWGISFATVRIGCSPA